MDLPGLLPYIIVISLLIATPGPLMALTMRNAVRYGMASVVPTYIGAVIANLLWAVASWAGISAFFDAFPSLKFPVQVAGALYLSYLGYQMLIAGLRETQSNSSPVNSVKSTGRTLEGFMIDAFNPKMIVFYTSFYSQFISKDGGVIGQFALLFSIQCLIGLIIMVAYGYSATRLAGRSEHSRGGRAITILSGCAMITFSVLTVVRGWLA